MPKIMPKGKVLNIFSIRKDEKHKEPLPVMINNENKEVNRDLWSQRFVSHIMFVYKLCHDLVRTYLQASEVWNRLHKMIYRMNPMFHHIYQSV